MTPRKRRVGALIASTVFVGMSSYAIPTFAADTPDHGVIAPEGLFVDVGSCTSSVQCAQILGGLENKFEAIDLTTLPDWDSALDADYAEYISAGANGSIIVLRNDSDEDITINAMPSNGSLLNHNTGESLPWFGEGAWSDTTLSPGEFLTLRPSTAAFGTLVSGDLRDYDVPTDYTWFLKTDKGDVEATWSGTLTGSWNAAIVDAVVTPDSGVCEAASATGKLSFAVEYTPSDGAVEWAKTVREYIASPEYEDEDMPMWSIAVGLGSMIHMEPESDDFTLSGVEWKQDGVSQMLEEHYTGITRSHPEWMDGADPTFSANGVDVNTSSVSTVSAPWADDGVEPKVTITFADLPIQWTNPDSERPATFTIGGESMNFFSGASFASTSADLADNPCASPIVDPEPTPTPEPTPSETPTTEPTPEPTPSETATTPPTPNAPSPTPTETGDGSLAWTGGDSTPTMIAGTIAVLSVIAGVIIWGVRRRSSTS